MASSSAAPHENLWSSILNSVAQAPAGQRRKNLVVLGEPGAGRSVLVEGLARGGRASRASSLVKPIPLPPQLKREQGRTDLAMGYTWFDAREEGDEETLPPLSVYVPPTSHASHLRLLPLLLSPPPSAGAKDRSKRDASHSPSEADLDARANVLQDTAVMVVLDWTKPGRMMEHLVGALSWVDAFGEEMGGQRIADEQRQKLQSYLQHYMEPAPPILSSVHTSPTKPSVPLPTAAGPPPSTPSRTHHRSSEVLPLGPGTLTQNPYGIPIFVVCTKADQIDLVAEELGFTAGGGASVGSQGKAGKGGWEERTDWVGCVLRTVGLMYGASIHHTSTSLPQTLSNLRTYVLHRLYSPLAPSTSRFPFAARAEILDRPTLLVPAGWDSWGKITAVKDGFEPAHIGQTWELAVRRHRKEILGDDEREGEEDENVDDLRDLWEEVVPFVDGGVENRPPPRVATTEADTTFLSRHYDVLQKELAKDPRSSFRGPLASASAGGGLDGDRLVGVVGPMGSGAMMLPGVQKAMAEMEGSSSTRNGRESRAPSSLPPAAHPSLSTLAGSPPLVSPSDSAFSSSPLPSPLPGGPAVAGQPPPSTEDLHNFFQSLLTNRRNTSLATLPAGGPSSSPAPALPPA